MMPVMDGPTTLVNLRSQPTTAGIPVVFMTARAQPRELDHFVSLGAEGVIAKPFDPMTLAAAVRNCAGGVEASIAGRRENFIKRARANAEQLPGTPCRAGRAGSSGRRDGTHPAHCAQHRRWRRHFGLAEMSAEASVLETAAIDRIEGKTGDVEAALDALVARIETT